MRTRSLARASCPRFIPPMTKITVGLALLSLSACGGASPGPSPPGEAASEGEAAEVASGELAAEAREVLGERCDARYTGLMDLTAIFVDVPSERGRVVVPALGDGYVIDCRPEGTRLVLAHHPERARVVELELDPHVKEEPDLAAEGNRIAREHEARAKSAGAAEITHSKVWMVGETSFFYFFGARRDDGETEAMLHVYGLIPCEGGLLRYHASERTQDPEALDARTVEGLVILANGFMVLPPP